MQKKIEKLILIIAGYLLISCVKRTKIDLYALLLYSITIYLTSIYQKR
jgi:hypothetical protein